MPDTSLWQWKTVDVCKWEHQTTTGKFQIVHVPGQGRFYCYFDKINHEPGHIKFIGNADCFASAEKLCSNWANLNINNKKLSQRACIRNAAPDLLEALKWYEEQARLCRLITSEGDSGRQALDSDGGQKARSAISKATGVDR